jgi:hypothetical protein
MAAADAVEGFRCSIHEISPIATMHVQINEARAEVLPLQVYN